MYKNSSAELMDRVRTVRSVRAYATSPMLAALCTGFFLFMMTVIVSVNDVIHNIMGHGGWGGRFSYTFSSLINSRFVVQVLAFLTFVSFCMIILRSFPRLKAPLYYMHNFISARLSLKFFRS